MKTMGAMYLSARKVARGEGVWHEQGWDARSVSGTGIYRCPHIYFPSNFGLHFLANLSASAIWAGVILASTISL